MNLWEKELETNPGLIIVRDNGLQKAAEILKTTPEILAREVEKFHYLADFPYFAEKRLFVTNKMGELVPFKVNGPQRKLESAIEAQKAKNLPVRICLLKARQWGGSTAIEGHLFRDSILRPNRQSLIVAHDLDSARHLREMSYRYYEHYNITHPRLKRESEKWWKMMHKTAGKGADSHIRIDTADELSGGHSLTLHNLHLSEIQLWRDAQELVKGLFPTVPNNPDTMIFLEGTGAGVGNYWYDFCQMAMSKQQDTWSFLFVPWFEIEDYTNEFSDGKAKAEFERTLDPEEKNLALQGISLEQLNWRRRQIRDVYKGDLDAFHQQYPSSPDEAFITSGRPVFPAMVVRKKMLASKEPLKKGYLRWKEAEKKAVFDEDPYGYWSIWEDIVLDLHDLYCCGADVAQGIAVEPEFGIRGGDFSAARVFRRDTRKMVATFHSRLDPDLFADELRKAWYYWKCPIFPEYNPGGHGSLVISRLRDDVNVELIETPEVGSQKRPEDKEEYGWRTTETSKRYMIDELNERIREEDFTDLDERFWRECATYVRDEKGKTNAQGRKYDDLVIATAITFQADKLLPLVFKPVVEVKREIPVDLDVPENWKRRSKTTQESVMDQTLCEF